MVGIPLHQQLSAFPAISRDFNFVVKNEVLWSDLEATVQAAAGDLLESVEYRETFRKEENDGKGMKRVLLSPATKPKKFRRQLSPHASRN